MITKCVQCKLFYKKQMMETLDCQQHFVCKSCYQLYTVNHCQQCEAVPPSNDELRKSEGSIIDYPIQGMMVHYNKKYNPEGQSQFTSMKNCNQRIPGWIMCNFLAIVFFFSGLSVAIRTSQVGIGVILTIVGIIGIVVSIYFIWKIKKIDKHHESLQYVQTEKLLRGKKMRGTISSVNSDQRDSV